VVADRWTQVGAAIVRARSFNVVGPVSDRPAFNRGFVTAPDRPVTPLGTVDTDPTCSDERRQMIADARTRMMQDPMVAAPGYHQMHTVLFLRPSVPARVWNTLMEGLMRTVYAGEVRNSVAQAIRKVLGTIARFAPMVADGWGYGSDRRILQMGTSFPGPHWRTVPETGITPSVGSEVCARIAEDAPTTPFAGSWNTSMPRSAGTGPSRRCPASFIPWVGDAALTPAMCGSHRTQTCAIRARGATVLPAGPYRRSCPHGLICPRREDHGSQRRDRQLPPSSGAPTLSHRSPTVGSRRPRASAPRASRCDPIGPVATHPATVG
jgi:hypothetical protein